MRGRNEREEGEGGRRGRKRGMNEREEGEVGMRGRKEREEGEGGRRGRNEREEGREIQSSWLLILLSSTVIFEGCQRAKLTRIRNETWTALLSKPQTCFVAMSCCR